MAAQRPRIALVSELARLGRDRLDALETSFELVERFELDNTRDEDVLVAGLDRAWGVVAGSDRYTEDVLDRLPELRIIARCGVGYDAIDVDAATTHTVVVSTTPAANADGVADLTLALMLACLRRVLPGDRSVRSAGWRLPGLSGDLTNATVGIIGLGRVGRNVARRLRGFGCRLLAVEPYPDREFCSEYGVEVGELDAILPLLDVLSIHAPLNPSTRKLIGARELALLKPSAVVVNTSRGNVVDEDALIAALTAGRLAGAGLDVYEHEPLPAGHPLTALENVALSPHAGSFSRLSMERMLDSVGTSLTCAREGRLPLGCINPNAWAPARKADAS